jgi:hypothetical protein
MTSTEQIKSMPFSSAGSAKMHAASSSTSWNASSWAAMSSLPASILVKSSTSLMTDKSPRADARAIST